MGHFKSVASLKNAWLALGQNLIPLPREKNVFITAEGRAPIHHPSKVTRKYREWDVVTRSLEAPWYLLVYDVTCANGRRVSQTSLVDCDEVLVNMLAAIPAADLKGIGRLDRCHGPGPGWALRSVDAMWKPAPDEARKVGPSLFRFDAETLVRDTLLRPIGKRPGRTLLYSLGSAVAPRIEGEAD